MKKIPTLGLSGWVATSTTSLLTWIGPASLHLFVGVTFGRLTVVLLVVAVLPSLVPPLSIPARLTSVELLGFPRGTMEADPLTIDIMLPRAALRDEWPMLPPVTLARPMLPLPLMPMLLSPDWLPDVFRPARAEKNEHKRFKNALLMWRYASKMWADWKLLCSMLLHIH